MRDHLGRWHTLGPTLPDCAGAAVIALARTGPSVVDEDRVKSPELIPHLKKPGVLSDENECQPSVLSRSAACQPFLRVKVLLNDFLVDKLADLIDGPLRKKRSPHSAGRKAEDDRCELLTQGTRQVAAKPPAEAFGKLILEPFAKRRMEPDSSHNERVEK